MRSLGVSERRVRLERDSWILMQALDPRAMPQRIRDKNAGFDDPETTRLYLACDQSVDWDPHDPRLDAWEIKHQRDSSRPGNLKLISSRISEETPAAWQRILDALADRAERRRIAGHAS
ncbi:hypothetical protein OH799_03410 [Nocardia sp. NBC_00881]|uniref:hypothetical protein n=1 Tax=Nocardia sp. NBC_00881 TaxID=2975995 RepID=UPI003869181B|nr:hypothetical protein OH799_03410 [Nocardia sp. NBC_00881]